MSKKTEEIEVQYLDPKTLNPHPLNPRSHPKRQREIYSAFRQGLPNNAKWLGIPLFNKRTGRLLNGHMRVEEAIKEKEPKIPIQIIDVDEKTETYILEHLDAVGYAAGIDQDTIKTLAKTNADFLKNHSSSDTIKKLSASFQKLAGLKGGVMPAVSLNKSKEKKVKQEDEPYEPTEEESVVVETYLNREAKFPSSNEWGIPDLLPLKNVYRKHTIPDDVFVRTPDSIKPSSIYCHSARPFPELREQGTLSFYTEDWRFDHIFAKPDIYSAKLLDEDWAGIIAPDFSTYTKWPYAINLYNVYRSRWCARFWQELNLPVIPTIQFMGNLTENIIIDTLPNKCPVLAMQSRKMKSYDTIVRVSNYIAETKECQILLIYGGKNIYTKVAADMPTKNPKVIYLPHFISERRKILDTKRAESNNGN